MSGANERRERIYGLEAALAVLRVRPDDVRRVAYHAEVGPVLGRYFRDLAARRIGYSEKPDDELRAIAGSEHHEGVVLEARERTILDDAAIVERFGPDRGPLRLVVLDGVENPHNVGAIVRTAAFLGFDGVVVPDRDRSGSLRQHDVMASARGGGDSGSDRRSAVLPPAAVRVAEGGAEHVVLGASNDLAGVLGALADRGVAIVGTDASAEDDARAFRFARRTAIVLGSEASGASAAVRARFTHTVAVRGTGAVDSLNVSVAAGIVLASSTRP